MTNVYTITRLKAILEDINDRFYIEDYDGDDEFGPIIRRVCTLDKQNEEHLMEITAKIKELISDIAENEEVI